MSRLPNTVGEKLVLIYEREYDELLSSWRSLERKAQQAAGAAGVVLTGALAFVGADIIDMPGWAYLGFPLIAGALFVSGVCALKALWVSSETMPPAGEDLRKLAWRLKSEHPDSWEDEYEREGIHKQVVYWDTACTDLHKSLMSKGTWVARAQLWLLATAGLVWILVFVLSVVAWRIELGTVT